MEHLDIIPPRSLDIPGEIPERDLILMFPHTYLAYREIIGCCHDPHHPLYPYYGGRGVRIEDRWLESFTAFLEQVGPAPTDLQGRH